MNPRFNKILIIAGIVVGVLLLSFFTLTYCKGKRELFALGKIVPTRIELLRGNDTLSISQVDGKWYINDDLPADSDEIHSFIGILQSLKGYAPASINPTDSLLSLIRKGGTLTRIFKGERMVKGYWVASIAAFNYKPVGLLMNSHQPYYVETSLLSGDLMNLFSTSPNRWLAGRLFPEPLEGLTRISVTYPDAPHESYTLNFGDHHLSVTGSDSVRYDDVKLVEASMLYFSLESLKLQGATREQLESARSANLIANVAFEMQGGKTHCFSIYRISGENFKNVMDEPIDYDPDRILIEFKGKNRFLIGYYLHFHHLLQPIHYLVNNSTN